MNTMTIDAIARDQWRPAPEEATALALGLAEEQLDRLGSLLDESAAVAVRAIVAGAAFKGKAEDAYYLPLADGAYRGVLLLGLGKEATRSNEMLRRAGGKAAPLLKRHRIHTLALDAETIGDLLPEALFEGVSLGQYEFTAFKAAPENGEAPQFVERGAIVLGEGGAIAPVVSRVARAAAALDGTNWARDLAHRPSNDLTPEQLAVAAYNLCESEGGECRILKIEELRELGMNGILAVGRGSRNTPRLILLRYRHPKATKTVALVGKGVTFDTGGISIKPGQSMHEMKYDMCGAAAVLGAFRAICRIKPAIDVYCVVPSAENMPGGEAFTPGEIITMYNGKTVETHNTDAEGRLILADALAYLVDPEKQDPLLDRVPDKIVNAATLTGAAIVALGHYAACAMTNDDGLMEALQIAADQTDERIWPLPLWEDYAKLMEGDHADLKNIPSGRVAGTITAGAFLQAFVGETPWLHLDIAGTAWGATGVPYWESKFVTGYGVRLFTQWVLNEAE